MPDWRAYPSAFSNGVNSLPDTVVDPVESIGTPGDAAATAQSSTNSVFALLKGCLTELGVPSGSGGATVKVYPPVNNDLLPTLGDTSDATASDLTSPASAIALTKHILALGGL